ncbi:DUF7674 family protein [Mucilaginibacter sp.]|uniref:DUF7674 family protein n=1 Tax=Mucilaginibacter sp. TaxID=1882438 RepID=UPI000CC1D3E1|nr:hypothetical protein [Mucilaginibacter sp.]PLW88478.1 MAG: hypothetical protein C0154_16255 [Mucilaginibacter sp.]PMP66183.1 MAG: hypothetical protein C0191_01225 [Mucilaginibacter sp.]HEK19298.1 hypothetical protein [Bacteroidota bacterium]
MKFKIAKTQLSTPEFLQLLVEQFPAIKDDVLDEDYKGLITLQVKFFTKYANNCISTGRLDEVRRVFEFFEAVLPKIDSDLDNALHVTFLERLNLDDDNVNAREASKLLNPKHLLIFRELRKWSNKSLS